MIKSDQGIEINAAAKILGISIDAARKRVQRGLLPAYKESGRWYVVLSDQDIMSKTDSQTQQDSPEDVQQENPALVEVLRDEIAFLRQELAARTEENRRKDHIIAGLTQRIPGLPADSTVPTELFQEISTTIERLGQQQQRYETLQEERELAIERRDQDIMQLMRQMLETKQLQAAAKYNHKWLTFFKRK